MRRFQWAMVMSAVAGAVPKQAAGADTAPSVADIEKAHAAPTLRASSVVQVDLNLRFGGKPRVVGTIYATVDGGRTRIEHEDGRVVVFDGSTAWVAPAKADDSGARFDSLTWSYFLLAPYKLGDSGAKYDRSHGVLPWKSEARPTGRLTFSSGVGDAPDDWYVVYADTDSNRLDGLAYIVTFGPTKRAAAEKEPHAIVYTNYRQFDGIPWATRWTFRLWSREKGVFGDPLGTASLSNFRRMDSAPKGLFEAPPGAEEAPLPQEH